MRLGGEPVNRCTSVIVLGNESSWRPFVEEKIKGILFIRKRWRWWWGEELIFPSIFNNNNNNEEGRCNGGMEETA